MSDDNLKINYFYIIILIYYVVKAKSSNYIFSSKYNYILLGVTLEHCNVGLTLQDSMYTTLAQNAPPPDDQWAMLVCSD